MSSLLNHCLDFIGTQNNFLLYFFSPEAQNKPTVFYKMFVYFQIPLHISLDLSNPKLPIAFYLILLNFPIITMPKFAIYKNCHFFPDKANIWFTENRVNVFPVSNSARPKFMSKLEFYLRVFISYSLHIIADLLSGLFSHFTYALRFGANNP